MRHQIVPHAGAIPQWSIPRGRGVGPMGGSFVQGFVAAGCVSAFQDRASTDCPVDLKRVLRHALQGGAALAAGSTASVALRHQEYTHALIATAAGVVGVMLIERLLNDATQVKQEKNDV